MSDGGARTPLYRRLSFVGGIFTLALLVILADVLFIHQLTYGIVGEPELPLPPNALGDTLAGFAGVLAFFWLVLGYFQQADEIRQSRVEMHEQAKALRQNAKESGEQSVALQKGYQISLLAAFLSTMGERFRYLDVISESIIQKLGMDVSRMLSYEKTSSATDYLARHLDEQMIDSSLYGLNLDLDNGDRSEEEFEEIVGNCVFEMGNFSNMFEEILEDFERYDVDGVLSNSVHRSRYGIIYNRVQNLAKSHPTVRRRIGGDT